MIGLGCAELVILALVVLIPSAIGLRMMRRRKREENPPEDDVGW